MEGKPNAKKGSVTTHYDKAPITEAIIDIQVKTTGIVSLSELAKLQDRVGGAYPERKALMTASVTLGGDDPENTEFKAQTSREERGWAFIGAGGRYIWQARRDGFSLGRLAPYERWQPFRIEAQRLWTLTREALQPTEITRVAVRYINRLELPLPIGDFKDYLRTVPEVSPKLPQALANFFLQVQFPLEDIGGMATISQTILPPMSPEAALTTLAVLLDIDVYRMGNVPLDDDGMWALFEQLRRHKNDVFEGCITDLTRELIR
jgi:uncharacterized protein (TIGR04255 family)